MKQLTEKQIVDNWNKLMKLIEDTFEGERKEKLLKMYKYFENRMSIAPASGKAHYHNAMVGGYVEHVLHVTDCAVQIKKLWESNGAEINFTDEEVSNKFKKAVVTEEKPKPSEKLSEKSQDLFDELFGDK